MEIEVQRVAQFLWLKLQEMLQWEMLQQEMQLLQLHFHFPTAAANQIDTKILNLGQ